MSTLEPSASARPFVTSGTALTPPVPVLVDTPGLHSGLPGFTRLGPLLDDEVDAHAGVRGPVQRVDRAVQG